MKKEYTYTRVIQFNFDFIIEKYGLNDTSTLGRCIVVINNYIVGLDDCDYYMIDNEEEIARDLYNYIQSTGN